MPKFEIWYTVTDSYVASVEADTEEEAQDLVTSWHFDNAETGDYFECRSHDSDIVVDRIDEVTPVE